LSIKPTYQELYATFTSLARQVNELEGLANQNQALIQENQGLIKENRGIIKQNQLLLKENRQLKDKLFTYENPKNSRNSSMPSSKDENHPRLNQSLPKSSDRKVG